MKNDQIIIHDFSNEEQRFLEWAADQKIEQYQEDETWVEDLRKLLEAPQVDPVFVVDSATSDIP